MPSEDKEKIREAEEKIREELKDKTAEGNQESLQTEIDTDNKVEKSDNDNNENQIEKENKKQ